MKRKHLFLKSISMVAFVALFSLVACEKDKDNDPQPSNSTFKITYVSDSPTIDAVNGDTITFTKVNKASSDTTMKFEGYVVNNLNEAIAIQISSFRYFDPTLIDDSFCDVICYVNQNHVQEVTYPSFPVKASGQQYFYSQITPLDTKTSANFLFRFQFQLSNVSSELFTIYVNFVYDPTSGS